jgi:hypothetical protein
MKASRIPWLRRWLIQTRRLGFRSLRQRLSLMPVAAVVSVSLIANLFVHQIARRELYESREQLARGLADSIAQRLSDQLSEVRDELSSWAPFLAELSRQHGAGAVQPALQEWLLGLGGSARSRYDLLALVDADGRIMAINEVGLSVPIARTLDVNRLMGRQIDEVVGEPSQQWLQNTWQRGLIAALPWRQIAVVNQLYGRGDPKTRDDNVRRHQLVFAVPLRRSEREATATVLVAVASWAPFQRIVDEAEAYLGGVGLRTGYGFLFDSEGDRIIGHKLRDPLIKEQDLLGRSVSRDYQLPHVAAAAIDASGRAFEYDFPPGNKKFAVFRAVEPAARVPDYAFDWRIGIGVDHSDIFAPLARLRDTAMLATLAIALAVAIVGLWLARSVSLSVKEFSHLAAEAAAGRFALVDNATSHDEISDLAAAMNRLFVSMRRTMDVQPIPNPYVVGTPVRSSTMFYGRQEDRRWINERLHQTGNELIILYGQRRIGKTSLLHQIRNQRDTPALQPVFVDTHALLPMLRGDDDFYAGIGRTIARELASSDSVPSGVPVHSADDLVAMIHSLNLQFPTRTLVLLFDEFEALAAKLRDSTLSQAISSFLGSLLESECRISIIATGSDDGSRLGGPFWSSLGSKAIGRRIGLLSAAEGLRLIGDPVGGHVEFEDTVAEQILRLSGAHPYYTQTICQRLVDHLNERHTRCATTQVLAHVIDQLLNEPPLPLDDMWSSSTSLQRWAMSELGRLLPDPTARVTADALLVSAPHAPTAVVGELRRLTSSELLEDGPGGYRFPVDFVRLWIRKEQLWWQVADRKSA